MDDVNYTSFRRFGLRAKRDSYGIIMKDRIEYIPIGGILVKIFDIYSWDIFPAVKGIPNYTEKITISGIHNALVWLQNELDTVFGEIISPLIMSDFITLTKEFIEEYQRGQCIGWLRDSPSYRDPEEKEMIEFYVFKDQPFTEFGNEYIGQLFLRMALNIFLCIETEKNTIHRLVSTHNLRALDHSIMCSDVYFQKISYQIVLIDNEIIELYTFENLLSVLPFEIKRVIDNGFALKICQNCDRVFIPSNRSDEKYCDRISPQDKNRTCKEYGSQKLWYDRLKQDEAQKLYRNIYMSKQMLVKRHPDLSAYKNAFENYKIESKQWKKDVKDGIKTRDEFLAWLKEVKEKKVL